MRTTIIFLFSLLMVKSECAMTQAQSTVIANTFILSGTKTTSVATGTNTVTPSTTQLATTKAADTMIKEAVSDALDLVPGIAKNALSVSTSGTGAASYNSSTGVINIPTPTPVSGAAIHDSAARSLNSNYTISATNAAFCTYSVSVAVTLTLLATSGTGTVYLEYSTNTGSTWKTLPPVAFSPQISVTGLLTLSLLQTQTLQINGWIPANALVRLRTSSTGTVSFQYLTGQEYY